jgi:hypothetical protein
MAQIANPLQDGCPGLVFGLGTTSTKLLNRTSFAQGRPDVYGFLCYEYLEEVQANVTFEMPRLSISTNSPPMTLERTARKLNVTYGNYAGPIYQNSVKTLLSALPTNDSLLDSFMSAIIQGRGGIGVHTILGQERVPKLIKAVQDLYATYMVQAIAANFRLPADNSSLDPLLGQTIYQGTFIQPHRQRLKQDPAVKWELQAMLLFMVLCAIVVFVFIDREATLPCSPGSIAGTMRGVSGMPGLISGRAGCLASGDGETRSEGDLALMWGEPISSMSPDECNI